MSRDGYLPPGVEYNDIDPPDPCSGCEWEGTEPLTPEELEEKEGCPGYDNCSRAQGEPRDTDWEPD